MSGSVGLVSHEIWSRAETAKQMSSEERRKVPIAQKESYKWLTALHNTVAAVPAATQVITVGDSEADIFELLIMPSMSYKRIY